MWAALAMGTPFAVVSDAHAEPVEETVPDLSTDAEGSISDQDVSAEPETDEARAERLATEGVAAFEAGELEQALELLQASYELNSKPNLVFNIGRIYEELGEFEQAIKFYSDFIVLPGVDLETREFAVERIEVIRRVLAQHKANDDPQDTSTPPPPTISPDPEPEIVPTNRVSPRAHNMRIGGAVVLGTGAAALITAAVLGSVSRSRVNEAEGEPLVADQNRLLDSARPMAAGADAMFAVGGAAVVVGAVLVGVSYSKKMKQTSAFVPSFDARHVSFGYLRRF